MLLIILPISWHGLAVGFFRVSGFIHIMELWHWVSWRFLMGIFGCIAAGATT